MADRIRFYKDPLDTIAYSLDWSAELGTNAIGASNWVLVNDGLVIEDKSFNGQNAGVLLSGGTVGTVYNLINYVTSLNGLIFGRLVNIVVQNRLMYAEQRLGEKLSYTVDWSDQPVPVASNFWLPVAGGLTYSNPTFDTKTKLATVTVNGGTLNTVYPVRHRLTTVGGQVLHKGYALRIV